MFLSKHLLNIALLRIGKHRIVKNIASLRKVIIAHPYLYHRWLKNINLLKVLAKEMIEVQLFAIWKNKEAPGYFPIHLVCHHFWLPITLRLSESPFIARKEKIVKFEFLWLLFFLKLDF